MGKKGGAWSTDLSSSLPILASVISSYAWASSNGQEESSLEHFTDLSSSLLMLAYTISRWSKIALATRVALLDLTKSADMHALQIYTKHTSLNPRLTGGKEEKVGLEEEGGKGATSPVGSRMPSSSTACSGLFPVTTRTTKTVLVVTQNEEGSQFASEIIMDKK